MNMITFSTKLTLMGMSTKAGMTHEKIGQNCCVHGKCHSESSELNQMFVSSGCCFFSFFFSSLFSVLLMSLGSHTWSAVIVSSRSVHTKWGISTDTV